MATLQVKQINRQGQISIGKKYAGKKVEVDEYPDGTVILKPVEKVAEAIHRLDPETPVSVIQQQLAETRALVVPESPRPSGPSTPGHGNRPRIYS